MEAEKTFQSRLQEIMDERGISLNRLADLADINKGNLSRYLRGESSPRQKSIYRLAKALDVDEVWLMGLSDFRKQETSKQKTYRDGYDAGIHTISEMDKIPVYNAISCGTGTWIEEYPHDFIGLPNGYIKTGLPLFANEASGDSMEPAISEGDLLIFSQTSEIPSGQIGSFSYEGEYYCKRYKNFNGEIWLYSDNPDYEPIRITNLESFKVLGWLRAIVTKVQ